MAIFYSASECGFFDPAIHTSLFIQVDNGEQGYSIVPNPEGPIADAVAITDDEHRALLDAQAAGMIITADPAGHPIASDPPQPPIDQLRASLCNQIDATADGAYIQIGGPSPGRLAEYQRANDDAVAFKAAGYSGTVPNTIACWVESTGWSAQQACDNILDTAAAWNTALDTIRAARLIGKANVNSSADASAAQAAADVAIANIRAVPAGL